MAVAKKPVGTVATEVVIGQSASNLSKAVVELRQAVLNVEKLEERLEELALNVSHKEQKIAELAVDYKERKRQADIQLSLDVKENETKIVERVLLEQGKLAVLQQDWATLNTNLLNLKVNYEDDVKQEKGKAEGIAKSKYEKEKELLEANFLAKEAGNVAEIKSLAQQVEVYKSQSSMLQKQLEAERQASVDRAKANAIGTVQIGTESSSRR